MEKGVKVWQKFSSPCCFLCSIYTFDAGECEEEHKILSDKKNVTTFNMENSLLSSRFYGFEHTQRRFLETKGMLLMIVKKMLYFKL